MSKRACVATYLTELYRLDLAGPDCITGRAAGMEGPFDLIMEALLEQESDGLIADSTLSLDLEASTMLVEVLVRVGDPDVAAQIGRERIKTALQRAGGWTAGTPTREETRPVELTSA